MVAASCPVESLALISNAETEKMRGLHAHLSEVSAQHADRPQLRIFKDAKVFGGWGLPMLGDAPLVTHRDGSGWVQEHIDIAMAQYGQASPDPEAAGDSTSDMVALLSFAGAYTYGHWFVDICPRLEVLSRYMDLRQLKFAVPGPLPAWAEPFLAAYDIVPAQHVPLLDGAVNRFQDLIVPHMGRLTDCLFGFPHLAAFKRLKAHAKTEFPDASGFGERLLVRHTPMTSAGWRSVLGNFDDIERALSSLGFNTITPASMSRADQYAAFSGARMIVGEDSSALHNIIYSEDADVVVIGTPDRPNLLHLSIAELMGHRLSYIYGDVGAEGQFVGDVDRVVEMVASAL